MLIYIYRHAKRPTYTIGKMYVNGVKFCDTLEDKDRGLNQTLPLATNQKLKVYGKTAIPMGRYMVSIHHWSKYGIDVPHILNVPAFTGILIHNGATEDNTEGCPLVGENNTIGRLYNGKKYMVELTNMVKEAIKRGEKVEVIISDIAPQFVKGTDGKVGIKKLNTLGLCLALLLSLVGCKTTSKIEYIDREVHVTDTVKEIQRDTIIVNNTKTDSIVVTIHDSVGIDPNTGETHHYHNESRASYKNNETDTYKAIHDENEHLRREVEELREKAEKVTEKEKKVYLWWPSFVLLGLGAGGIIFFKLKKKFCM